MLTQLPNPIPLITPKGKAYAVAIIDYGPQWDLLWVTFIHDTGECWTYHNKDIRQDINESLGICRHSPLDADAPPFKPYLREGHESEPLYQDRHTPCMM
jgi:hypothetical protein